MGGSGLRQRCIPNRDAGKLNPDLVAIGMREQGGHEAAVIKRCQVDLVLDIALPDRKFAEVAFLARASTDVDAQRAIARNESRAKAAPDQNPTLDV